MLGICPLWTPVPRKSPMQTSAHRTYPNTNQGVEMSTITVFGEGAGAWGEKCQVTTAVSAYSYAERR